MKLTNVFMIAEISANHGQNFERAAKMVIKAKESGADAVKFQAYSPDTITINCKKPCFQIRHPQWGGQTLYDLYKKGYTPWHWFPKLKKIADDAGIVFFATAFDKTSVDMLEGLKVPFHKVASFELVDIPLIEYIGKTKKPLIMSTGMASLLEIREAVSAAKKAGTTQISLLKCVSSYPADPEEMNLLTIPDMQKKFNCPVGLSDHTLGSNTAIASVALGAQVIEKHFILSRRQKTTDSFFSAEPTEFKELVENVRIVEKALGGVCYDLTKKQKGSLHFRKSLFVITDIKKGESFTEENIASIRPGFGLGPKYYKKILGKRSLRDIARGTPLDWKFVSK